MTTTNLTSDEREELLKQVRKRHELRSTFDQKDEDIETLLSLLDSYALCRQVQKRGEHSSNTCACVVAVEPFIQSDAATRMRDKCVEKVREMKYRYKAGYGVVSNSAGACDEIIAALESLTLDQVEQETK